MKITDIRLGMLRVPLKTAFKTALRTVNTIQDIVVMVETDSGHTGYGEAPATAVITGDIHGSIIEAIRTVIKPKLIGQDISDLNHIIRLIQGCIMKNYSAKAAVEMAVYDLFAQLYKAPLYKILGGGVPKITTDITISVDYIDKMVADSLSAIDRGFETLKVCTAYNYKGEIITHFPYNIEPENVTPIYTEFKGWQSDLTQMKTYEELPQELKTYIEFIEKSLEVPVQVVSVGPDRTQTINR